MPQISQIASTYASQIFWLLVTFGALYFFVGKLMVPKIQATVDARDTRIASDLAAAEAARRAADETEEAWRAKMDQARAAAQAAQSNVGGRVAVQPVQVGRATLFRARVTGLSQGNAQQACDRLRRNGACNVLSPDAQG